LRDCATGRPRNIIVVEMQRTCGWSRRTLAVLLIGALGGCGTTATIRRSSGPAIEAEIVGGDRDNVYYRDDNEYGSFRHRTAIGRDEITDIDHPGNVAALLGGILAVYGLINISAGAGQCSAREVPFCVGVFLPAAIGVPWFGWGMSTWIGSRSAAQEGSPTASKAEHTKWMGNRP
jgi:hypothetical protein